MQMPLFTSVRRVLCIGAHPDDIEIGCGGALMTLQSVNPTADIFWTVLTSNEERAAEARHSAGLYLEDADRITVHGFADNRLPYIDPVGVKNAVAGAGADGAPDLVFTPRRGDAHQDHRFVGELAWQVFRGAVILEYEIVKWDGDLTPPNVYVPLSGETLERKIDRLFGSFGSQHGKPWFDRETFRSLARIRGVESGAASGYAEAFHAAKIVLG